MFFSIIVPIYKTEKYLHLCIESILEQSYRDFELILVEDGSPDHSPQICDFYSMKYHNIKVIHQKNQGLLLARRNGIAIARGEYVMHVDSDDFLLPGALQKIHDVISANECDLLFFDYIKGEESAGEEIRIRVRKEKGITVFKGLEEKQILYEQLLVGGYLGSLWIKVAKRSIIDSNVDYSIWNMVSNGEDYLQSFPLLDQAKMIVYLPDALYYYRRNNDSMSKHYSVKDFESFKKLYLRKIEYAKKWNLFHKYAKKLAYWYWDANMVILRDVRLYNNNQFVHYLKGICNDPIICSVAMNLPEKKLSIYYQTMRYLILHKNYTCINMIMWLASKRIKYN